VEHAQENTVKSKTIEAVGEERAGDQEAARKPGEPVEAPMRNECEKSRGDGQAPGSGRKGAQARRESNGRRGARLAAPIRAARGSAPRRGE